MRARGGRTRGAVASTRARSSSHSRMLWDEASAREPSLALAPHGSYSDWLRLRPVLTRNSSLGERELPLSALCEDVIAWTGLEQLTEQPA